MKKANISIVLLIAFTAALAGHARADSIKLIDIPLKYEIKSRGDGGFFSTIYSIAADSKTQSLYALHDDPILISSFYLRDGNKLEMLQLDYNKIKEQASVAACDGRIFILSQRLLWELDIKKRLVPVKVMPEATSARADLISCYSPNGLLMLDITQKRIDALAWNGTSLRISAPAKNPVSGKMTVPFSSADQFFMDRDGTILLLDAAAGGIRRLTPGKSEQSGVSLASPNGSSQPWHVSSFAVDPSGNLWTVNTTLRTLDVYDSFGDLRYRVEKTSPNGFRFINPQYITIDETGILYMIDAGSNSIKVFDVSRL